MGNLTRKEAKKQFFAFKLYESLFLIAFPLGDISFPSHRSNSFQTPSFLPKIPQWDLRLSLQHPFLRKCTRLKLNTELAMKRTFSLFHSFVGNLEA